MRRELGTVVVVAALWACGGVTAGPPGGGDGGSSSGGSSGSGSGSSSGGSSSSSGSSSGGSSSSGSSSGGSSSSSGSSSGGSSSGADGGRVPANHRPSDAQCSTPAPPGDCFSGAPGMCQSDSACTAGTDGRCVESGGGALICSCTYDSCMHDTDCKSGSTCACHGSPYLGGQGNTCVPGNCRVDADCGADEYCSPSFDPSSCGSLAGYFCHTAHDVCLDDIDCATSNGPQVCIYSTTSSHWECHVQLLCG